MFFFFFQAEDGIRDFCLSRGLGDVYKRQVKSKTKAEDIIWFKIDENTHQSIIIYSSEADAQEENAQRQAMRKDTITETGHSMVEETMGEVLSIMSEV